MRRDNQSTQDATCLARALFYDNLHRQVSSGLLSVADADRKVEEYNHPQLKPILDIHLGTHKFLERIGGVFTLNYALKHTS